MPWTKDKLPDNIEKIAKEESWSDEKKKKFAEIATAILKESEDEGIAIATALKRVRGQKDNSMTIADISAKHGVGTDKIREQLIKGIKVELEHFDTRAIEVSKYDLDKLIEMGVDGQLEGAVDHHVLRTLQESASIAFDHLMELPDYYDRLAKMEKKNAKQMPEIFYCRHIEKGVTRYEDEDILVDDDALGKMNKTFKGKPVRVLHVDEVDMDRLQEESDGYVIESFYNKYDGWHWAKFICISDAGHNAIAKGWSVSNAYIPTEYAPGGDHHNVPYNRKITDGEYAHLAIVPNPRYERAKIFTEEQFKEYNEEKKRELSEIQNSKKEKGTMLKFWKNKKEAVEIDPEARIQLENGKEVSIKEMMDVVSNAKNEGGEEKKPEEKGEEKINMDMEVEVGDQKMSVKELVNRYQKMSKKNEDEEEEEDPEKKNKGKKKNAEGDEEDPEKKNEDGDEDEEEDEEEEGKENKGKKSKKNSNFDMLKNAVQNANGDVIADLPQDQLARGQSRYGSGK